MKWYALQVISGKEERVQKLLKLAFDSELSCLIPKRKLYEKKNGIFSEVVRKLFPGYVFINTILQADSFHQIKRTPHVIRLLNHGGNYYTPIPEQEMVPILRLVGNDHIVESSKVYIENSKVIVMEGPLYGLEGIIKKVDKRKKRAKILLNLYDNIKFIDVSIDILQRKF